MIGDGCYISCSHWGLIRGNRFVEVYRHTPVFECDHLDDIAVESEPLTVVADVEAARDGGDFWLLPAGSFLTHQPDPAPRYLGRRAGLDHWQITLI